MYHPIVPAKVGSLWSNIKAACGNDIVAKDVLNSFESANKRSLAGRRQTECVLGQHAEAVVSHPSVPNEDRAYLGLICARIVDTSEPDNHTSDGSHSDHQTSGASGDEIVLDDNKGKDKEQKEYEEQEQEEEEKEEKEGSRRQPTA